MIKQKKKYSRPQRPFDKARIDEENILRERYGLKNKKEIWKADAAIGRIRNLAKTLITASDEDKNAFIERLRARGFKVENIADALALDKEDWLKRRLQTVLLSKGLTTTAKQARQLIAHKHVSVGDQIVNVPSYMVTLEEEPQVSLNITLKVAKPKSKEEQIKEEIAMEADTASEDAEDPKSDEEIMASEEGVDAPVEENDAEEEKVEEAPAKEEKEEAVEENVEDKSEEAKE